MNPCNPTTFRGGFPTCGAHCRGLVLADARPGDLADEKGAVAPGAPRNTIPQQVVEPESSGPWEALVQRGVSFFQGFISWMVGGLPKRFSTLVRRSSP